MYRISANWYFMFLGNKQVIYSINNLVLVQTIQEEAVIRTVLSQSLLIYVPTFSYCAF